MKSSMKGLRLLGVTFAALALSWHVATNAEAKDFCVATVSELQAALTLAQANGQDDVIRIVQETYNGNFIYASTQSFGVTLEGGYASGCAARTVDPNNTLLDAGGSGSVLVLSTNLAANFVVDGLAIKHGNVTAAPGGGLYVNTFGDMTLSNCIVSENTMNAVTRPRDGGGGIHTGNVSHLTLSDNLIADNVTTGGGAGGGIRIQASNIVTMTNNVIRNNVSSEAGGGVFNDDTATVTLSNNILRDNTAKGVGAGFYTSTRGTGPTTLNSNLISNNNSTDREGGGIFVYGENLTVKLTNNIIVHNSAINGGGVFFPTIQQVTMINNTLAHNTATTVGGVWIELFSDSSLAEFFNNVMWSNDGGQAKDLYIENDGNANYIPSPVSLFNNNFDQSTAGTYIQLPFTIDPSNLNNLDPLFVDAPNDDYHLTSGSPCLDKGTQCAPSLPALDFEGDRRIQGLNPDMGADEFASGAFGSLFAAVQPCRIVDTRLAGGAITPGGVRSYNVYGAVASQGGNPSGCPSPQGEPFAVALNVTAVPLGQSNIVAYPFCSTAPTASLVNYKAGVQNVANSGTVKTCFNCTKDINIKANFGTAHVVIDVLGYYFVKP